MNPNFFCSGTSDPDVEWRMEGCFIAASPRLSLAKHVGFRDDESRLHRNR
jgi:hypothetical protein